jgi:hypothetical protein
MDLSNPSLQRFTQGQGLIIAVAVIAVIALLVLVLIVAGIRKRRMTAPKILELATVLERDLDGWLLANGNLRQGDIRQIVDGALRRLDRSSRIILRQVRTR